MSVSAFYLFTQWRYALDTHDLIKRVATKQVQIEKEELDNFIQFLKLNHLLEVSSQQETDLFNQDLAQQKKSLLLWVLHNYLFIKIPLIRPDLFLTRLYPSIKSLFNLQLHWPIFVIGILGVVMVMRQWQVFTSTFSNMLNAPSIGYYIIALVFVKSAHELGHALVAKRYACRVSSMGIAFLLMTPILYTDTTDAWRLRSRFQRLSIVTAGVRVEIYIACVATFLWGILPDGSFRNMVFFVATTSWVSSLLINISPFMRFDGYYAFSDFLGMENLQIRSFLVGKWFLRECLFGFGFVPPEPLNRQKCLLMVVYAWCTWLYRLFIFIGIAFLVYFFTFKLLGVVLFVVEVLWFVLLPIIKEVFVWHKLRSQMSLNRASFITLSIMLALIALLVIPWRTTVSVPAVMTFERYISLYPSEESEIISWQITPNARIEKGQGLVELSVAELEKEMALTRTKLDHLNLKWQRSGVDANERSSGLVLKTEIAREASRLQALEAQQAKLSVKAPFNGVIGEWLPLERGDYVTPHMSLATLYDDQSVLIKAYISGQLVTKVQTDKVSRFIANDGTVLESALVIDKIIPTSITQLNILGLSSLYGGAIASQQLEESIIPNEAIYEVHLKLKGETQLTTQALGKVNLFVKPESYLMKGLRHLYGVFIKESAF
ncbi:site-2 protease family protein [Marinomonas balearica]|uniref:site-2 protease family protein n=1 Tax=Marinomonas balearica TaxID=491947 RepID=UPI001414D821|nr:site-2 protease family protein [Marinomonas balearica]